MFGAMKFSALYCYTHGPTAKDTRMLYPPRIGIARMYGGKIRVTPPTINVSSTYVVEEMTL